MFRLLLAFLICMPFLSQGQSLTIKNGEAIKTFAPQTYYEFYYGDINTQCCNTTVKGMITRVFADSIQVRLNDIRLYNKDLDFLTELQVDMEENNLLYTLPKSELLQLTAYKNRKQANNNGTFVGIGGVLIITGIVTLANSYDFGESEFRDGILISGGVQLGLGISLLALSKKKRYDFTDGWQF